MSSFNKNPNCRDLYPHPKILPNGRIRVFLISLGVLCTLFSSDLLAQLPAGVTFPNYELSTSVTEGINQLPANWTHEGSSSTDIENYDMNYQGFASLTWANDPATQGWSQQTSLITSLYTFEAGTASNPDLESYSNTISGLTVGKTYSYSVEAAYNNLSASSGAPQGRVPYFEITFDGESGGVYQLTSNAEVYEFSFEANSSSVQVIINDNISNDPEYTGGSAAATNPTNPQVMILAGSGSFNLNSCAAGEDAPILNDNPNFSGNTYTISCGAQVADLSQLSSSNLPSGSILTYHSGTPTSDGNKVAPATSVGVGTYYVSFFNPAEKCYSEASQQISVVKDSPCGTDSSMAFPVDETCTSNAAANATTACSDLDNEGRILFFDWQGTMANGQMALVTSGDVTYTASISNYEHITNSGTPVNLTAADLNGSDLWQGTKMKYMYTGPGNEGWQLPANEDGLHRWTVSIVAEHSDGFTFPVNVLAFDMESTNQPQNETVVLQSLDGSNWSKLEDYNPSCAPNTNFGLGNGGPGIIDGVGTTTITYLDTENNGGNSYWISEGATAINMEIETASSRQGIGVGLFLDCDSDGDGIPDKYETAITGTVKDDAGNPLVGVTVELFDEDDNSLGTVITGADGSFVFENVPPGVGYKVVETDPSGYESESDTDGANDNIVDGIQVNYGYETSQPQFVDKKLKGEISGTLYNDTDGLSNNTVDGQGINTPSAEAMYANLVDGDGNIVATAAIGSDGSYSFSDVDYGDYTMQFSSTEGTVGQPKPAITLPDGWVNTGEYEGTMAGDDGSPDGELSFSVDSPSTTNINAGIQQPPTANAATLESQTNPGGTVTVGVPAIHFDGDDQDGGVVESMTITSFPSNATSLTVNGTEYTSSTFPAGGIMIPTDANGNPTQAIGIDPIDGDVTVVIPYTVTDNAGYTSNQSTVEVPFSPFLPVQLSHIIAIIDEGYNLIEWTTVSELNNDRFEVESSIDGWSFEKIGEVQGKGSSGSQYRFKDTRKMIGSGTVYYRLKQVDYDGKYEYSPTVFVKMTKDSSEELIYPNPVINWLYLETKKETSVTIYSLEGKILVERSLKIGKNPIDVSELQKGTYIIKIGDGMISKLLKI